MDQRLQMLRVCLDQLRDEELQRILDYPPEQMLCDHGNYDPVRDHYCPLAIAFRLPETMRTLNLKPSDQIVEMMIGEIGRQRNPEFLYNQMSGIPGEGYRQQRQQDVLEACAELLQRRRAGQQPLGL